MAEVKITVTGKDDASTEIKKVEDALGDLGDAAKIEGLDDVAKGIENVSKAASDENADALSRYNEMLKRCDTALADIDETMKDTGDETEDFGIDWDIAMIVVNQGIEILFKAADAIKAVYDMAKEGAELDLLAQRFDNLADSVGAFSYVLIRDLRDATGGIYSDAELMAGASDLMATGLAKSNTELVRIMGVIGGLGVPTDKVVDSLTQLSTANFDKLGLSTEGFKDKVKELERAGYSANDAFKEAFLQTAAEQILTAGSAADSASGQFLKMEAATTNVGNAIKQYLGRGIGAGLDMLAAPIAKLLDYHEALNEAQKIGVISADEYSDMTLSVANFQRTRADVTEELNEKIRAYYLVQSAATRSTEEFGLSLEELEAKGLSSVEFITEMITKMAAFKSEFEGITGLSANFTGIISYAEKYDDILEEIADNEERIAELMGVTTDKGVEERNELIAKNEELNEQMTEMANQVVLDMMQATIAIGGVTEAEMTAYFDMAADMGMISEEAAAKAIEDYGNAVDTVNDYVIDPKTGEINFEIDKAQLALDLVNSWVIEEKVARFIAEAEPLMSDINLVNMLELADKAAEFFADTTGFDEEYTRVEALEIAAKMGIIDADTTLFEQALEEATRLDEEDALESEIDVGADLTRFETEIMGVTDTLDTIDDTTVTPDLDSTDMDGALEGVSNNLKGIDTTTVTPQLANADMLNSLTRVGSGLDDVDKTTVIPTLDNSGMLTPLSEVLGTMDSIDGSILKVNIEYTSSGYPEHAAGGPVYAAGGLPIHAAGGYWVGEAGPEPFFPAIDGRIISNTQALQALREGAQGNGMNVIVTINTPINMADRAFVERELAPYIYDAMTEAMRV